MVGESRVGAEIQVQTIGSDAEDHEVTSRECAATGAHDIRRRRPAGPKRAVVRRPEAISIHKSQSRRRDGVTPTHLGIHISRTRQHIQTRHGEFRTVGDASGGITNLLESAEYERCSEQVHFDRFELKNPAHGSGRLHPAVISAGHDPVDFIEGVVTVFRIPKVAGEGIEGEAESVAVTIRVDLLNVAPDLASDRPWRGNLPAVKRIRPDWADGKPGSAATTELLQALRQASPNEASLKVIELLNREITAGLANPTIKTRFADLGAPVIPLTALAFTKFIADEVEKWARVVRAAGITPEG